jgi:hypothetical protein
MDSVRGTRAANRPIVPVPGGTFITREIEAQDDIIDGGLLPRRSILVVGGSSKIGKSIFGLNMSLCLVLGKPFLLQFPIPKRQRVLYIQAEISERSMQDRLVKMVEAEGIDQDILNDNLLLINHKGLKFDRGRDLKMVGEIVAHYKTDVMVIDPMYKFHSGDENQVRDITRFFDSLDSLVFDFNCSIALCHHFSKPSQNDKRYGAMQLRGSSAIFDYADSYVSLNRKSGNEPRNYVKATFELRNEEDPNPLYLYRNPDTLWYEVLGDESQSKISIHDVVTVLTDMGGQAKRQELLDKLNERTGVSKRRIGDVLIKAENLGKIKSAQVGGPGRPKVFFLPSWRRQSGEIFEEKHI